MYICKLRIFAYTCQENLVNARGGRFPSGATSGLWKSTLACWTSRVCAIFGHHKRDRDRPVYTRTSFKVMFSSHYICLEYNNILEQFVPI
jgi:hypothetical protein